MRVAVRAQGGPGGGAATEGGAAGEPDGTPVDGAQAARQRLMLACARATVDEMAAAVARFDVAGAARDLRPVETGLVMLRGRVGATGAPFNVGEVAVTRAAVRLPDRSVGFGYQMGRSHERARLAAVIDALGQDQSRRTLLETDFITPVLARAAAEDRDVAAQSAQTRVDFLTMARGEDEL